MTLALLIMTPVFALNGLMSTKVMAGFSGKNNEDLEHAGKIVDEALGNANTVASLVIEDHFQKAYSSSLSVSFKRAIFNSFFSGIMYSISQAVIQFVYAFSFYYGAKLIQDDELNFKDVMMVVTALLFSALAVGQTAAIAPDLGKAKEAYRRLFIILDSVPSSNAALDIGFKPSADTFKSRLRFQDVHFSYCNRPGVNVLQGFSTTIEEGQTVALIGHSGCGKSTVISLLERFYSCDRGSLFLDIFNVEDLNVQWLRQQMAIVSQEPTLFNCSIAENIAYGDNSRIVRMDEIIQAAKSANIHNFIEALPEGYHTNVGKRGTQLSGGQKQRIAIARALVRNPKILLLDEATSALDTESERMVQEAIDKVRQNRTSIVIAHRLSTILNSDKIMVIDKGTVVEQGNHKELMAKKGAYYKLIAIQNRS